MLEPVTVSWMPAGNRICQISVHGTSGLEPQGQETWAMKRKWGESAAELGILVPQDSTSVIQKLNFKPVFFHFPLSPSSRGSLVPLPLLSLE